MNALEYAVQWAVGIAEDDTHGYDQANRQGPDYDCSSLVINAFHEAGFPVKSKGATYTGNMKSAFLKSGFINVISSINLTTGAGLFRGDVLLRESGHAAIYLGGKKLVNAQWNEKGTKTGGQTGDQTKKEICIKNYYNSPWSCILRLSPETIQTPLPPEIIIPIGTPEYSGPVAGYIPDPSTNKMLKVMKRYYIRG